MSVTIKINDGLDLRPQVFLSDSTFNAKGRFFQGKEQNVDSFFASNKWRLTEENEWNKLVKESPAQGIDTVGFFKIPDSILDEMHLLLELNNESELHNDITNLRERISALYGGGTYAEILERLMIHVNDHFLITPKELVINRLNINKAGLSAVSFSQDQGHYPGLHVDYWDNRALSEAKKSRNRLCVNLGKGPRGFLMIDRTVEEMHQLINEKDPISSEIDEFDQHSLVYNFLTMYPDQRVIKILLNPGEGYIAPTENIPHDGSTEDSQTVDVNLPSRGYYSPASLIE